MEKAFSAKNYKLDAALIARAQQIAAQLHMSAEGFVNQYESFALVSDWSNDVTAQRLKTLAEWLETEQRKENAKPRGAPGVGTSSAKILPQAAKPTWEDLPDKIDFPTPSAKRQALDPAALNPGTGSKSGAKPVPGSAQHVPRSSALTPPPPGSAPSTWATTPIAASAGRSGAAATPAPPSAFSMRTNRGQVMASLNEHLQGPEAVGGRDAPVSVRALGQPALDGGQHLFMMEVLESKVAALDERIMDFADAVTAATRATAATAAPMPCPAPGGTPGPATTPEAAAVTAPTGTPPPPASATPGAALTPGAGAAAAAAPAPEEAASGAVQPLQHSVADISHQPVWVAGRVLAEAEGAPLNAESLLLEGCREASGGARVRLDVSCLPGYRLFPGQSVCAYGLNPTGSRFIAQRLVTHVPPPPPAASTLPEAARSAGLSMVVAAGPFCLSDDLAAYSPLDELLAYCSTSPPDVLMLLGPFVDAEHPGLASGSADRTAEALLREEVLRRLAGWRTAAGASTTLALMPAVRDVTSVPVVPQPPMTAAAAAVGPADKVVALQNPATAAMGPLVVAAGSGDVLKALSAAELARLPPAAAGTPPVERMPALAGHLLGQRSCYPLYPAPLGTCLDTSHYSQLSLAAAPDMLLMPSDLAPFAKVLRPESWAAAAPPGLVAAGGCPAAAAAPVVIVNPGRLSRGGAGGSFAHVVVVPGSGPLHERVRVEVKRV
ncbi:hypothetical protein HYH02_007930 [Chlamydomonas schloesseri]|uniref:DNA polymerase alpha subunit B n=1 Tax=Chlamydomonas schloesseri TaxID=2026947 RepID=A0A836B4A3_9CHLO|nr:hypothetical protein HYH02_007930 [Chlamydomonas schloesseri]|eukprot:KAG2447187.1 hypothetical protein HYH02_007930 [Chlamydomonas schloesseri]